MELIFSDRRIGSYAAIEPVVHVVESIKSSQIRCSIGDFVECKFLPVPAIYWLVVKKAGENCVYRFLVGWRTKLLHACHELRLRDIVITGNKNYPIAIAVEEA